MILCALRETFPVYTLVAPGADERWGDAPVHSLATAIFLRKDEVHFFDEIGYYHDPFMHVPLKRSSRNMCRTIKPRSHAMETSAPVCLKTWIRHNWLQPHSQLPFETYLDDLPRGRSSARESNPYAAGRGSARGL